MKKSKVKKIKEIKKEYPITVSLRVAGQDRLQDVDNILDFFRTLDIDPSKVKSRATFEISYKGETLRKIMTIIQFKRLLANNINKQMTAKLFNRALDINVTNYE
jgi:hypothetical protein